MLMLTNGIVVKVLNSLLLPVTGEVWECTGHISIQIENVSESLIQMSGQLHVQGLNTKRKDQSVIHNSGRGCLQGLLTN